MTYPTAREAMSGTLVSARQVRPVPSLKSLAQAKISKRGSHTPKNDEENMDDAAKHFAEQSPEQGFLDTLHDFKQAVVDLLAIRERTLKQLGILKDETEQIADKENRGKKTRIVLFLFIISIMLGLIVSVVVDRAATRAAVKYGVEIYFGAGFALVVTASARAGVGNLIGIASTGAWFGVAAVYTVTGVETGTGLAMVGTGIAGAVAFREAAYGVGVGPPKIPGAAAFCWAGFGMSVGLLAAAVDQSGFTAETGEASGLGTGFLFWEFFWLLLLPAHGYVFEGSVLGLLLREQGRLELLLTHG